MTTEIKTETEQARYVTINKSSGEFISKGVTLEEALAVVSAHPQFIGYREMTAEDESPAAVAQMAAYIYERNYLRAYGSRIARERVREHLRQAGPKLSPRECGLAALNGK